MKKLSVILLSGVVLALAGCGNQGSSSDPYNTESGTASNTNDYRGSVTNDYLDGGLSPGGSDAGVISSTNFPGVGTNDQNQPIVPERTNTMPMPES